jgi:hypothetical protein
VTSSWVVKPGWVSDCSCEPVLDVAFGVKGLEVEDEVSNSEDASRAQDHREALEGDRLPEVGQLFERVACLDEVRWCGVVWWYTRRSGLDDRDVVESVAFHASSQRRGHGRRNVDGDHLAAQWRD